MHPGEFYLPFPRGAPNPTHVVGSGAASRATGGVAPVRRLYTVERGYPYFKVLTVAPGPTSGEGASL
jgi:hypothetical protein